MNRLLNDAGVKLNPLRNCDASLRAAVSGILCCGRFCDATHQRHPSPRRERGSSEDFRDSCSSPWKTLLSSGRGHQRRTKAATTVIHGLAEAGDASFCPRPAICKQQITQIAATTGRRDKFAVVAIISWTLCLRVQPECLLLSRQRAGEDRLPEDRLERR